MYKSNVIINIPYNKIKVGLKDILADPFLWLVIGLSFSLRIIFYRNREFWFDELFGIVYSDLGLNEMFSFLWVIESHPPLHYLQLHIWYLDERKSFKTVATMP